MYANGRKIVTGFCIVYAWKNELVPPVTRCGFTVTKKVGKAVVRNSIKRKFREIFFSIYGRLQPGYDLVIVAKSCSADVSYRNLREDIIQGLANHDLFVS